MKSRNSIPEPVRDKLIEPWIRPALPGWWANLSTQSPMDIACRFEHVPPRRLHFSGPRHIHPPDQESAKGKRPAYSCWSALRRKESVRGNPVNGPPRFQLQGQEMTIYISSSKKAKPPNFWRPALPPHLNHYLHLLNTRRGLRWREEFNTRFRSIRADPVAHRIECRLSHYTAVEKVPPPSHHVW